MAPKAAEREGQLHPISFRATAELREKLDKAASAAGRSLTQEITFRLEQSFAREGYVEEAKAVRDTQRIQAIREAGFRIVRELGTGKTMVQISAELLLAEADGILRSGFAAAEDIHKSPTEIMVERAVQRVLERAGIVPPAGEEAPE
jgi:hypothetical protein